MVYVEGAAKFMRNYKRLMLHRIQWTEPARARGDEEVELEGNEAGDDPENNGGNASAPAIGQSTSTSVTGAEEGEYGSGSLDDNRCDIIWEGNLRERSFKTFKPKSCPTDALAKEALGPKMIGYWDMVKNWKEGDEDLF